MPVPLLAPPRLALRPHAPVVGELTAKLLHLLRIRRPIAIMLLTILPPLLGQVLDLPLHVDHVSLAGLDPLLASSPSPLRHPRPDRAEDLRHRLRDHQQNSHHQRDVYQDRVFTHRRPTPSSAASTPSEPTADRAAPRSDER